MSDAFLWAPEERFDHLHDDNFAPTYIDVDYVPVRLTAPFTVAVIFCRITKTRNCAVVDLFCGTK